MSQPIAFETDRLRVADWREVLNAPERRRALADELRPVLTPPVLEHLPPALHLAEADGAIEAWVEDRAAESDVLTIRDKGGVLLGLMILAEDPETDFPLTVHIGYLLAETAWGKGFATELIEGLLTWYRGEGDAVQIYGGVGRENPGSARVLLKNGFTLDETRSSSDTDMFGLYISCDYDRLYATTKNALGAPGDHVRQVFAQDVGRSLRVLDIGCGQGRDSLYIARLGHSVVGVDLSSNGVGDMRAVAKREGLPVEGIVADVACFEPNGAFDIILIDRTLHMLSESVWGPVLRRLMAHGGPRGRIVIIDEPENIPVFKGIIASGETDWGVEDETAETVIFRRS